MIDELDRAITDAVGEIVSRTPELGPPPSDVLFALDEHRGRRSVVVAALAVAAAGVLAVGAAVVIRSGTDTDPAPATQPPAPPALTDWYIPAELPDGMVLLDGYHSGALAPLPVPFQVYGEVGADLISGRAVQVEVVPGDEVDCSGVAGATTVDINGVLADQCDFGRYQSLSWVDGDTTVVLRASRHVTADEIVRVARTLTPNSTADLPQEWGLLFDRDELVTGNAREIHYEVDLTSEWIGPMFSVTIYTGVPEEALWLFATPFETEHVELDPGRTAYAPSEMGSVFWVEEPGVVVLVQSEVADRDGIVRFAASLERADEVELEAFLAGATTPPDPAVLVGTTTSSSTTTVPSR